MAFGSVTEQPDQGNEALARKGSLTPAPIAVD
jgi:hypothetical protein